MSVLGPIDCRGREVESRRTISLTNPGKIVAASGIWSWGCWAQATTDAAGGSGSDPQGIDVSKLPGGCKWIGLTWPYYAVTKPHWGEFGNEALSSICLDLQRGDFGFHANCNDISNALFVKPKPPAPPVSIKRSCPAENKKGEAIEDYSDGSEVVIKPEKSGFVASVSTFNGIGNPFYHFPSFSYGRDWQPLGSDAESKSDLSAGQAKALWAACEQGLVAPAPAAARNNSVARPAEPQTDVAPAK